MVEVTCQTRWTAASWLFDWVLNGIAGCLETSELASSVNLIVQENLGWLSLEQLSPEDGERVVQIIKNRLLEAARRELSADVPNRAGVIEHLQRLVELVDERP